MSGEVLVTSSPTEAASRASSPNANDTPWAHSAPEVVLAQTLPPEPSELTPVLPAASASVPASETAQAVNSNQHGHDDLQPQDVLQPGQASVVTAATPSKAVAAALPPRRPWPARPPPSAVHEPGKLPFAYKSGALHASVASANDATLAKLLQVGARMLITCGHGQIRALTRTRCTRMNGLSPRPRHSARTTDDW